MIIENIIIENERNRSQEISTVREKELNSVGGTLRDHLNTFLKSSSPDQEIVQSPTHITIDKIAPTEISTKAFQQNMMEV
jgi:hypothetical protein